MSTRKLRSLFLEELTNDEVIRLKFDWPLWARLKQRPPLSNWRTWLLLGGRGAGKTRTGAEWLKGVALADPHYPGSSGGRVALVGTSYDDMRNVMVEGDSGLLAISQKGERPAWYSSRRELVWPNGVIGSLFSSVDPEGIRGNQFGAVWCDVFVDPKSAQSALPYHSNGARDDLIQRRYLEVHYDHWAKSENNPISQVYNGPMLEPEKIAPWAWDARPYPWFPLDTAAWSDGGNWHKGHWLNGRLGGCPISDLVRKILFDHGIDEAIIELDGVIDGYAVPGAISARQALEPLIGLFDIAVSEEDGKLVFRNLAYSERIGLNEDDIGQENQQPAVTKLRSPEMELPNEAVVHHVSVFSEYEDRATKSRRLEGNSKRQIRMQSAGVMPDATALELAEYRLRTDWTAREEIAVSLGTGNIAISAGDIVKLPFNNDREWLVGSVNTGIKHDLVLRSVAQFELDSADSTLETGNFSRPKLLGMPDVLVMDLPLLRAADSQKILSHVAISANPWGAEYGIYTAPDLSGFTRRGSHSLQAINGQLLSPLMGGVLGRWDYSTVLHLSLIHGTLQAREETLVLNGANSIAVESSPGKFELIQFQNAELQSDGSWLLSRLLRGQLGSDPEMAAIVQSGARVVLLDERVLPVELESSERNIELNWRIGPVGYPVSASNFAQITHANRVRSRQMLSPVHLRSFQTSTGDYIYNWVRRSRIDADNWDDLEIPLDAQSEQYRISIIDNSGTVARQLISSQPEYQYLSQDRLSDLGSAPTTFEFSVAQISASGSAGADTKITEISN